MVDETVTLLEIDGEPVKTLGGGDLHNRNCLRCLHPEIYETYRHLEKVGTYNAQLTHRKNEVLNHG